MDNIIDPDNNFDFTKLSLDNVQLVGTHSDVYFTRLLLNNKPLFIQTNNSLTKQGIVTTAGGKKCYCDLIFDSSSEILINWFENLEETCKTLIFDKSEEWFQNTLDKNDVDSTFNPVMRIYKSGKCYLLRTNIKVTKNTPIIKIYNENEHIMNVEDVTNETYINSILEIQGIKFTSKHFQIEIEMKQIMVLKNDHLFENCLIKTQKTHNFNVNVEPENTNMDDLLYDDNKISNTLEEMTLKTENNNDDLQELNINLDTDDLDTFILKKPNQVYYDLYKEARNQAKEAKINAITAFLKAKNIKKTYLIDILDEESDIDNEIEETTESELKKYQT